MVASAARESEKFPLFSDDQQFNLAAVDRQVEEEEAAERGQGGGKVKRISSLLHLLRGVYFLFRDENY